GEDIMSTTEQSAAGGELNAEIANAVVGIIAEFTGHGPSRSRAFVHEEVVVCLLEDGLTRAERNLIAAGRQDLVDELRDAFQRSTKERLVASVEHLTGRTVATF